MGTLSKLVKRVSTEMSKRSPEILAGIGIAGMITTTVLAVKVTPKAIKLIEERENEIGEEISKLEKVKVAWKPYIPAIVTGVASAVCLIGSCSAHSRRTAAITTAYKLSETALSEYKEKVIETIGEKKEQAIKEKIDKDHIEKNPVSKNEIIITKRGKSLCYDSLSGRYFESDIDFIKSIQNELNAQMINDIAGYIALNDFYDELGLARIDVGDELGWNVDRRINIRFGSQIADDGKPCIVVAHDNPPFYEYEQ